MIKSFADREIERLYRRLPTKRLDPRISRKALTKPWILDAVVTLDELRSPPGNRLEVVRGNRLGKHGIRINDQWRICFIWTSAGPESVEIVGYH